ncbi:coiled-coil domain-containing protein 115 [Takifugu flavidus]|uniref:coiled-coil domain-containing protein 115 n=1 Tax=Takifugu flavidus TaxID=433684 RepID=UPI002543FC6F|nr:coiled-coil domain-containing protein 115 [Takifugu flavidus]
MGVSKLKSSVLLDEELLRFMELLELLEEKRTAFNSLIEQGWFSISKARYSMGNKQVSALQYASEIEPLVHVHTRTLDNGGVDFHTERVQQNYSNDTEQDARSVEDIGPQEEGVRRRKGQDNRRQKDMMEKDASHFGSTTNAVPHRKSEPNPGQDPLKWFGILVPQSLKQAQSSFKQVLELSAEIAALQTSVINTRQELKRLMKDKRILEEKVLEEMHSKTTD